MKQPFLPWSPLTFQFRVPEISSGGNWLWNQDTQSAPSSLGGHPGTLRTTTGLCGGLRLIQEEFRAADDSFAAFRSVLENPTGTAITVTRLFPFACRFNPDGIEYFCEKRLKPEKPYSAVHHGEEVEADNVLIFRHAGCLLLIGWLDQHRHPARILIEKNDGAPLLSASADYFRTELPAGEKLATQWCEITTGNEFNSLLAAHAQRAMAVADLHHRGRKAPSVISSWHYFGKRISREILEAELEAIRQRHIPADVYQVDAGWYSEIGDWECNRNFPDGLSELARRIRSAGMTPGIWVAPFLLCTESRTARQHPEWFLRDTAGALIPYNISSRCAVLDLSRPAVLTWLESQFRRLREAGFRYFKADFTRAVFVRLEQSVPHDRRKNLLASYREGIAAIRAGIGEDSFLNICGGHSGGNMGIADSQRTGHDTYGCWYADDPTPAWQRIRQGMFRSWMSAWRHNDPDAAVIRLCSRPFDASPHGRLPLGDLTDREAELMVLHQFLAGGTVALGENIRDLQEERLRMMRRVMPSAGIVSRLLDPFQCWCPSRFAATVPRSPGNPRAFTLLSAINVRDDSEPFLFRLTGELLPEPAARFLVCDATDCQVIGLFSPGDEVRAADLPPHGCRVLRITPVPEEPCAFPAVSDGHYAALELVEFEARGASFQGRLHSSWLYPLRLVIAVPEKNSWSFRSRLLPPSGEFSSEEFLPHSPRPSA